MKLPVLPPKLSDLIAKNNSDIPRIMSTGNTALQGRYLHWDELRRRDPPDGLDHEQWWLAIKLSRGSATQVPLTDAEGKQFKFFLPKKIQELLHYIDRHSSMGDAKEVITDEVRRRFVVSALMEESITSSQLEGASTTRLVAQEMLRYGRAPRNKSEIMILNNYRGMRLISDLCNDPLTKERVLNLHKILTAGTLDDPRDTGRLQIPGEERVKVMDQTITHLLHLPPPAEQLPRRFTEMLKFANDKDKSDWIHPLIRAIILHFWLAFDHPFVDGNGRTSRSIFYWYVLKHDYKLFEFLPISALLLEAPAKYYRSFLYTETDDQDLTYFIIHQLETIRKAIDRLNEYLNKKMEQVLRIEKLLKNKKHFNYRQLALLGHAICHPGTSYTIKSHQNSHEVAYATARSDLLDLSNLNLLTLRKSGHALLFEGPPDLESRVKAL